MPDNSNSPPTVFKTYDGGYVVREMTKEDAKIVQRWYSGMSTVCLSELNVPLEVFPRGRGFYIGEYEGEVVASVIRVPWGPDIYYGSYYYVAERFRGRGFGTRLRDDVAFGHVGKSKLCIDAVLGKVTENNEKKFGYKTAFISARFRGTPLAVMTSCSHQILPMSSVDFGEILEYDDTHFIVGGNPLRHECLRRWCREDGGAAYTAIDDAGDVRGFGVRRPCMQEKYHMIGPLYADDVSTAVALMNALCDDVRDERIQINIWRPNEEWVAMMPQFGLELEFNTTRMHANGDPHEYKATTYAVTSIDGCGF